MNGILTGYDTGLNLNPTDKALELRAGQADVGQAVYAAGGRELEAEQDE